MLTKQGLEDEVARRVSATQMMMREQGVGALIVAGGGAPGAIGAIRYLSNAHLWGGAGYVVLGLDDPDPWLFAWSAYQAVWSRNEAAIPPERVESPDNIVARCAELVRSYVGTPGRIGVVNMLKVMSVGEHRAFTNALEGYELVELTGPFNALRQIKSPFELEAIIQNGATLDASMDVFREHAYVGARYWDVCAAVEAFVKAKGSFWGRTKLSLDLTPYTVPAPKDLRMGQNDVINFEIVYESPWGYWLEMTTVFSFGPLPDYAQKLLDAYLAAVDASAAVAREGNTFRDVSEANDHAIRKHGFSVVGKHTPDCHSTGLDGSDGPNSLSQPDFSLKSNMVLSYHPGTVLEGNHGFLISDNFMVTPQGAVRLSPHTADRYHLRLGG